MNPPNSHVPSYDVFFLGAGKPALGDKPAALKEIGIHTRALDWQLHSISVLPEPKIYFLGGYHIEDIIASYPQLHYIVVPEWQTHSIIHTLLQAPWRALSTIVSYTDTVFRPDIIRQVDEKDADVVWVYDANWRSRYENRHSSDIARAEVMLHDLDTVEFTGLVKFSPAASSFIAQMNEQDIGSHLMDLIHHLAAAGFSTCGIDAQGAWTEFNSPLDIAHFVLGTKAETLSRLRHWLSAR